MELKKEKKRKEKEFYMGMIIILYILLIIMGYHAYTIETECRNNFNEWIEQYEQVNNIKPNYIGGELYEQSIKTTRNNNTMDRIHN